MARECVVHRFVGMKCVKCGMSARQSAILDSERKDMITPNEYQDKAARTDPDRTDQVTRLIENIKPGGSWLLHSQIGLAGEVGELAAAIQRWLYYGKELDRVNVIEELGDLCWYLAQACRAMDVKLEDVMAANLNKLKFRYPERYTDYHAAEENRDRAVERDALEAYSKSCAGAMAKPPEKGEYLARTTGPKQSGPACPRCKTPLSDRAKFCPECGCGIAEPAYVISDEDIRG